MDIASKQWVQLTHDGGGHAWLPMLVLRRTDAALFFSLVAQAAEQNLVHVGRRNEFEARYLLRVLAAVTKYLPRRKLCGVNVSSPYSFRFARNDKCSTLIWEFDRPPRHDSARSCAQSTRACHLGEEK